jgi:hypothetical protein
MVQVTECAWGVMTFGYIVPAHVRLVIPNELGGGHIELCELGKTLCREERFAMPKDDPALPAAIARAEQILTHNFDGVLELENGFVVWEDGGFVRDGVGGGLPANLIRAPITAFNPRRLLEMCRDIGPRDTTLNERKRWKAKIRVETSSASSSVSAGASPASEEPEQMVDDLLEAAKST